MMAAPANGNGNGRSNLIAALGQVPMAVWGVIFSQFLALAIWAIRLDQRVQVIEEKAAEMAEHDTIPGRLLKQKFELLEERQRYLTNYVLFLREQMVRAYPPAAQTPSPPLTPPEPAPAPQPGVDAK